MQVPKERIDGLKNLLAMHEFEYSKRIKRGETWESAPELRQASGYIDGLKAALFILESE